jgi:hypothetical protein
MFNNIQNSAMDNASEEDVLAAMGDTTETGKKATGKTDTGKTSGKTSGKSTASNPAPASKATVTDVEDDDLDSAFGGDDDDDEDEVDENEEEQAGKKKDEKKKDDKKKAAKKEEVVEDEDEDDENEEDDEDEDDEEEKKKATQTDDEEDDDDNDEGISTGDFLKARVSLLIEKGEWSPFEKDGKKPEDLEWTEELFEEVELEQRAAWKNSAREEILDSFGPYGRDIAQYSENGGDPDDLIDIFKEEQAVKAIDITTEQGQKDMVFEYLTKVVGRSAQKAQRDIERFIADKELEDEAKEAKSKIESGLKQEREDLIKAQDEAKKAHEKRTKDAQDKFSADVTDLVNKSDDIPADEKKQIIKMLTTFKKELPNGTKVNDFYAVLAEFRKSLPNYIKMVRLVLNPEKYDKRIENKGKTKQAEKAFKLARGAQAGKKAKPSSETAGDRGSKKSTTGFKLM